MLCVEMDSPNDKTKGNTVKITNKQEFQTINKQSTEVMMCSSPWIPPVLAFSEMTERIVLTVKEVKTTITERLLLCVDPRILLFFPGQCVG